MDDIIYTFTDEAPALATISLYPMIKKFLNLANISISLADISLSGRILAAFGHYDKDYLKILGDLTQQKEANIIKLPNISASLPQLNSCIAELQNKGFSVPNYEDAKEIYAKILGSAVNPVLRQGNCIRKSSIAIKKYAKAHPHSNGEWNNGVKTEISYMSEGDFYSNEKSKIFDEKCELIVEFTHKNGKKEILKKLAVEKNEIIDATFMSAKKLDEFIENTINLALSNNLLYSIHLKATMMKISDPVIFGHFVRVFFAEIFTKFHAEFQSLEINPNNGLKTLFEKIEKLSNKDEILRCFDEILAKRPALAMVDSKKGITNLHVPSDVIIDASMPAMIRNSGKMWDKNGVLKDTLAIIPDKTYAIIYEAMIWDLKQNGALDASKIGSVTNIGLMAKKAQEYGSHDKTFIMSDDGEVVVRKNDEICFKFKLEKGDIFRMTQTKFDVITNWIQLAKDYANTGVETIFWLDENRASDKNLINIVKKQFPSALILSPKNALLRTNEIIRSGQDAISVSGNVLRDYLTDLYPILELGTSAKMLSIVPLLNGGGLFETGAGGSAPKHVEQFIKESHLRWDSLGEFLALSQSLEHLSKVKNNKFAQILAAALENAIALFLQNNRSPRRDVGQMDNRNSHFYLALYFAKELSKTKLGEIYSKIAKDLEINEDQINAEILSTQGKKADLGGYYKFDLDKANSLMRPSETLNQIFS